MKAVRIHAWGEPPRVEDLPEPMPQRGRSLVRMAATTASHLDRSIAAGAFLRHPPLPYVPGVEAAGTVLQSDAFAVGTRVWLRGGGLGTSEDGTWRETISARDTAIAPLPDAIAMPLGAAFFSPCTAAWSALFHLGALQAGERVVVSGGTGRSARSRCSSLALPGPGSPSRSMQPVAATRPMATTRSPATMRSARTSSASATTAATQRPPSICSSTPSAAPRSPASSRASCPAVAPSSSATPRVAASSSTSPS
jgi:hypothetical protein